MDLAAETAADVERRLERLRDRYGGFPLVEETVENDPAFFADGRRMAEAGWRGDAGAWVTDDDGRVLLVRHPETEGAWGVPGGGHEPGERLAETAVREVREETGVACEVTGVWRARRREIRHAEQPERRLTMLTVWFEAEAVGGDRAGSAAVPDGDEEVLAARWFAEPPDRVVEFLAERVESWRAGEC